MGWIFYRERKGVVALDFFQGILIVRSAETEVIVHAAAQPSGIGSLSE